jgi:hypothetical protein
LPNAGNQNSRALEWYFILATFALPQSPDRACGSHDQDHHSVAPRTGENQFDHGSAAVVEMSLNSEKAQRGDSINKWFA